MHNCFFLFAVTALSVQLSLSANTATAQVELACNGIGRIETSSGSGTGFVVASRDGKIEVWTNGHVTGPIGSDATVRFSTGLSTERTFRTTVAARRYQGGADWAKLIGDGTYEGHVFTVGGLQDASTDRVTGGFPHGGSFYSLVLSPRPDKSFGEVTAYLPSSIPGQSGSPVVDLSGSVVGVVTMYFESKRKRYGGFLPIDDWKGQGRVSVRNVGSFKTLGNAPSVQ